MLFKITSAFCVAVTLVAASAFAEQDQSFRRFLSAVAQKEAQVQAKKIRIPLNQGGFQGQLEMPYPEKIQVNVAYFQLKNDTVSASVAIDGDYRISGIWTREGQSINVKADVAAKLSVTGLARVEKQKSDFFLAPTLTDCDFKILKISIQDPVELAEGDVLLTEIANTAFQNHKATIISQINRSLTKYQIKF